MIRRGNYMLKKFLIIGLLVLSSLTISVSAQTKTVINSAKAKTMLLGKHKFSLQWISWDYFGTATVTQKNGVYYLKGEQKARKGTDFVKIDGVITEINEKSFIFDGKVISQISHINNGEPCERNGEMTFKITGKRKYWRLQQMETCDGVTDYVDIFFK